MCVCVLVHPELERTRIPLSYPTKLFFNGHSSVDFPFVIHLTPFDTVCMMFLFPQSIPRSRNHGLAILSTKAPTQAHLLPVTYNMWRAWEHNIQGSPETFPKHSTMPIQHTKLRMYMYPVAREGEQWCVCVCVCVCVCASVLTFHIV